MSTFSGLFEQFPFISADRFDGENLRSKVFFLSHCHADHMVGLGNPEKLPGPLYTSGISQVLVRKQFPNLQEIRVLEIDSPEEITYRANGRDYSVVVTALPARHCPGSIMLLFETQQFRVLYTGDFRLSKKDMQDKFTCLNSIALDEVYLDSTFLNKRYMEFPTQIESVKVICNLISEWTSKSENHKIIIEIPAQYGSEFIFMEIERKLRLKIYVDEQQYEKYLYFPDMDRCISNNPSECRILNVQKSFATVKTLKSFIGHPDAIYRIIRPSAIYWKCWKLGDAIFRKEENEIFRVAYSSHSSCRELEDFIEFVKPKSIKLNVFPISVTLGKEMKKLLSEILDKNKNEDVKNESLKSKQKFDNLFLISNSKNDEKCSTTFKMPIKRVKL